MNSFNDIFELMKNSLEVSDTARHLWIDPIKPVKLNNNKVVLYLADSYVKKIVEENYSDVFKKHFKEILGFDVEIEFITDGESESVSIPTEEKLRLSEPIPELQDDPYIVSKLQESENNSNYKYTFDTFIVGENNHLAYAACKSIAQGQGRNYNPLYIYSEPGLGKTHLLCAVKNEVKALHPEYNIVLVSAETFVNEFVNSVRTNTTDVFKQKYRTADMLLVDDVQFFSGKKESQNELFHTFNDLYQNKKTDFRSYFITFEDGARLEIMNKPDMVDAEKYLNRTGLIHIAFSVGSKERVDEITQLLQTDGYHIVSGPRTTGDGYYESCVAAIENNQIEFTV